MFIILERLRGSIGEFKVINGFLLALFLFFLLPNHPYIAMLSGAGYIFGNKIGGWGLWKGSLSVHRESSYILHTEREGGVYTGIQKFTEWILPPTPSNWLNHCRMALFLRGLWWWIPTLAPLYFTSVDPISISIGILVLAIGFPVSCDIGYYTSKIFNFNYMDMGWEHSEVEYGFIQDMTLITLILI